MVSTKPILYTPHCQTLVTCIVEFWYCYEGILYSFVIAKKKRSRSYERVHVCTYVRVTLVVQHISLMTLEGMITPFLVVPTAVETNGVRTR